MNQIPPLSSLTIGVPMSKLHLKPHSTIETVRFKLSLIQREDVDAVFETMNSQKTADIITFLKWPITQNQAANWCEKAENGFQEQKEFLFLVRNKEDLSPVGCVSLHIKEDPDTCEVGYWVSENWQGKGCATEMLRAMIELAFHKGNFLRIIATAAIENPASLHVLQKQGFQIIGSKDLSTTKGTILKCHLVELRRNDT